MNTKGLIQFFSVFVLFLSVTQTFSKGFTINHLYTEIASIPDSVITKIKDEYYLIHGHLSHGWQIDDGLDSLEVQEPNFAVEIGNYSLPNRLDALNIMYYYASDKEYWNGTGAETLRGYLDANENINVAIFSWCRDLDTNSSEYVYAYLDTLSKLELEYPNISFVYMTGNAQNSGEDGLQRYNNNNIIREFCQNNDKVLYDFADLDCWWYNPETQSWEDSFYTLNNITIPIEHSRFHKEEWHHTTVESGLQKAKALWYLLAKLSGWETDAVSIMPRKENVIYANSMLVSGYPNPFNSSVTIEVRLNKSALPTLEIFNISGSKVYSEKSVVNSTKHHYHWDATSVASGVYIFKVQSGRIQKSAKLILIK